MISNRLFGTDGVRGITNDFMNPEFVVRLSGAIGTFFGKGSRLLVGMDARAGSYFIRHVVIGTLLSEGLKVYDAGLIPIPALQYYIKENGFDGGIMITASHNPPEYSGIKVIMGDGVEAPRNVEKEIEEIFWEKKYLRTDWRSLGYDSFRVYDVIDYYINGVIEKVDAEVIRKTGFKVVVDGANSVGSLSTPKLLRRLGVKIYTINTDISHIPNRAPEPTPESLKNLSSAVRVWGADFGVAHDGDADRAIYVDSDGEVISGDRTAVLLCKHLALDRRDNLPKRVVTAVSSSTIIEDALRDYGIEIVWTKVGSVGIARKMMEIGAMAGFEENGGFMFPPHQYVRDGAMSIALMLEYLAMNGTSLREEVLKLPRRYSIKTKVPLKPGVDLNKVNEALQQVFGDQRVITVDGIKVIGKDYWFLVRPSGTEPVLRVFVEAADKEKMEKLLNSVLNCVKQVLK